MIAYALLELLVLVAASAAFGFAGFAFAFISMYALNVVRMTQEDKDVR